jgi:hypothetical protein
VRDWPEVIQSRSLDVCWIHVHAALGSSEEITASIWLRAKAYKGDFMKFGTGFDLVKWWKDRFTTTLTKFKETGLWFETENEILKGFVSCHTKDDDWDDNDDLPIAIPFTTYDQGFTFGKKYAVPYFILVSTKNTNWVAVMDGQYKPKITVREDAYRAEIPKQAFKIVV